MKIKTFEFLITNAYGNHDALHEIRAKNTENRKAVNYVVVYTAELVDKKINSFIKDKDVVKIDIGYYTADRHNNGYGDSIVERVTVMYNVKSDK